MSVKRKLAATAAAMVLALGGAAAVGTAARAVPPDCTHSYGHEAVSGSYVMAYNWWYCPDGTQIAWPASVQRFSPSGVYETVATGKGDVIYYCTGLVYNLYRAFGSEAIIPCT